MVPIILYQEDTESKLGVYKSINPNLKCYISNTLPEFERVQITRYRTGSHNLLIEKGRYLKIPRENRVCVCDTGIQSLNHVIFSCPLTKRLPGISSLDEFFILETSVIISSINDFKKALNITG